MIDIRTIINNSNNDDRNNNSNDISINLLIPELWLHFRFLPVIWDKE